MTTDTMTETERQAWIDRLCAKVGEVAEYERTHGVSRAKQNEAHALAGEYLAALGDNRPPAGCVALTINELQVGDTVTHRDGRAYPRPLTVTRVVPIKGHDITTVHFDNGGLIPAQSNSTTVWVQR